MKGVYFSFSIFLYLKKSIMFMHLYLNNKLFFFLEINKSVFILGLQKQRI